MIRKRPPIEAVQGSDNWHAARRGKLTASRMADAMSFLKNGTPARARIDLMMELVAERMTGVATDHYVTPAMQWGLDNEAGAIKTFENKTGLIVEPAGFVLHPTIDNFGASPDGFAYPPESSMFAIVEVKCPTTKTFVDWCIQGKIPENYRWQMVAQMACCRTREGLFVAYDPRVTSGPNLLVRELILEDDREIVECEEAAKVFLQQTDELFDEVIKNAK